MFPTPGRIVSIEGIDTAEQVRGVEHISTRAKVGETIPPYEDCVARPLFAITSGDTRREALEAAELACSKIKITTEDTAK